MGSEVVWMEKGTQGMQGLLLAAFIFLTQAHGKVLQLVGLSILYVSLGSRMFY